MRKKIDLSIDSNIYRKFRTALTWFDDDETAVIEKLMMDYSNSFINNFREVPSPNESREEAAADTASGEEQPKEKKEVTSILLATASTADERRKLFVEWFGTQKREGKPYSKRTIELYANKLANACKNPVFDQIPVKNLFEISNYSEFKRLEAEIENAPKFAEFCEKTPGLFGSALRKYGEFLDGIEKN